MSDPAAAPPVVRVRDSGLFPLLGFIVLSAFVHAFGFYIFQAIYPPASRSAPPPIQVGVLVPGTPEADALLRWIDSEDPALAAEPTSAPAPGLMSLPYSPSYQAVRARPTMVPATEAPLPYPAGVSGLDLVRMAASHPTPAPPAPAPVPTALDFSGALAPRLLQPLPSFDSLREAEAGEQLRPARFLVGVSDGGEVRYVFLEDSSGDPTLDAAAGRVIEQARFRPSDSPYTWGFATYYWGSAAYAQPTPGRPMIHVSLEVLLFVYLGLFLALIFGCWIVWNVSRLRRERQAYQHRLRCTLCSFEFSDPSTDMLPRCPRCGSLNERAPFRRL